MLEHSRVIFCVISRDQVEVVSREPQSPFWLVTGADCHVPRWVDFTWIYLVTFDRARAEPNLLEHSSTGVPSTEYAHAQWYLQPARHGTVKDWPEWTIKDRLPFNASAPGWNILGKPRF